MAAAWTLVRRSVRLYFSDALSVVLSLLGALIALVLVLVFLKSSIVDSMTASYGGLVSAREAGLVLDAWLVPSAAVIASATTALGALRQFVDDKESNRWRDFLVSPAPRWAITLGYLVAAALISMLMTTVVFLLGTGYCALEGVPLTVGGVAATWAWLLLSCLGFTGLMGFVTSFLRTAAAFGGVSILIGVLFGFLSETYITSSTLPASVSSVLHCLPFSQASAVARSLYAAAAINALPSAAIQPTREAMGIAISVGSTPVTTPVVVVVLGVLAVGGATLAWRVMAGAVRR